jgi:16S rRNA (guanine527-N7)-methyltransferase
MVTDNERLLIEEARRLGIEVRGLELELFNQYLSLLDKWSSKMNLTAIKGERERIIRLILDSLNVVRLLDDGMRVIDIGSGAGLPGIPVKIVIPGIDLVLCESRKKRAEFLKEAVRRLGLEGVKVFDLRAEQWEGGLFDAALVRGVGALDALVSLCSPLLRAGGELIAMKGPGAERELAGHMEAADKEGLSFRETIEYNLPEHEATFSLVILEKA